MYLTHHYPLSISGLPQSLDQPQLSIKLENNSWTTGPLQHGVYPKRKTTQYHPTTTISLIGPQLPIEVADTDRTTRHLQYRVRP